MREREELQTAEDLPELRQQEQEVQQLPEKLPQSAPVKETRVVQPFLKVGQGSDKQYHGVEERLQGNRAQTSPEVAML